MKKTMLTLLFASLLLCAPSAHAGDKVRDRMAPRNESQVCEMTAKDGRRTCGEEQKAVWVPPAGMKCHFVVPVERIDVNKDGFVDGREVFELLKSMKRHSLMMNKNMMPFSGPQTGFPGNRFAPPAPGPDMGPGGEKNKFPFPGAPVFDMRGPAGMPPAPPEMHGAPKRLLPFAAEIKSRVIGEFLKDFDENNDGRISRKEWAKAFKKLDIKGDSAISREDIDAKIIKDYAPVPEIHKWDSQWGMPFGAPARRGFTPFRPGAPMPMPTRHEDFDMPAPVNPGVPPMFRPDMRGPFMAPDPYFHGAFPVMPDQCGRINQPLPENPNMPAAPPLAPEFDKKN